MITLDLPDAGAVKQAVYLPALRSFLLRARRAVALPGQVSILLTSDKEIRRLNRIYRGKDKATDVLSFPAAALPKKNVSIRSAIDTQRLAQPTIAGDLAISVDTAARQAKQFGHPVQIELKILILHGLLHLGGLDHEADAGEMASREDQLRRRFCLPTALIARTVVTSPITRATRNGGRR